MAYSDLQSFLADLERDGDLSRVRAEVDPHLEVTGIVQRVVRDGGPALLFENPSRGRMPLAINVFGTQRRMAKALGVANLDDIGARIADLVKPELPHGIGGLRDALAKVGQLRNAPPRRVRSAPCQEVVLRGDEVDLDALPGIKAWPEDGGVFLNLGLTHTKHPETGARNLGMYRLQQQDNRTVSLHWQIHKDSTNHASVAERRGERLPVAIAFGCPPAVTYAASAPLPADIDEYLFAGFLQRERVDMVDCVSVPLQVPAAAQIVLEGWVEPGARLPEGPFGDHTGFYTPVEPFPYVRVETMTMRTKPIYQSIIVGRPPQEDGPIGKATERIFLPLIRLTIPEIVDYDLPEAGVFHNCVIVSIDKRFPKHAQKVMNAIWGAGLMSLSKLIVVVDADCDVHDYAEVAWRAFGNVDYAHDALHTVGPVDHLDHAAYEQFFGGKLGIDATRKLPAEGYSPRLAGRMRARRRDRCARPAQVAARTAFADNARRGPFPPWSPRCLTRPLSDLSGRVHGRRGQGRNAAGCLATVARPGGVFSAGVPRAWPRSSARSRRPRVRRPRRGCSAGNANASGTNFIGPTVVAPLIFKTSPTNGNPVERARIGPAGHFIIRDSLSVGTGTEGTAVVNVVSVATTGQAILGTAPNSASTALNAIGTQGIGTVGVQGTGEYMGVQGTSLDYGVFGYCNPDSGGTGVYGRGGWGVHGRSYHGFAVYGDTDDGTGVKGESYTDGGGVKAIHGEAFGVGSNGVVGEASNGTSAYGVWGLSSTGYAGFFSGKVTVTGTLSKGGGSFKIDHPLDPANKYLYHSFVESPDMMNVYNGNVRTDSSGKAKVTLPDYFMALNKDFRYQLTVVGQFAQAIVGKEIEDGEFEIHTDKPRVKVSWQVTGIRQDAFANANRIPEAEDKVGAERGTYLHPEAHGKPSSAGFQHARIQALTAGAPTRRPDPVVPR